MHSKKYYIHGAIGCIYFLAAVTTFLDGLSSFFDKKNDDVLQKDGYTFILPVAVIVFDYDYKRVSKRAEFKKFLFLKAIFWLAFLGIYIAGYVKPKNKELIDFIEIVLIVAPLLGIGYSFLLQKFNFLSTPIGNGEVANV
jgi:hypothetical protein